MTRTAAGTPSSTSPKLTARHSDRRGDAPRMTSSRFGCRPAGPTSSRSTSVMTAPPTSASSASTSRRSSYAPAHGDDLVRIDEGKRHLHRHNPDDPRRGRGRRQDRGRDGRRSGARRRRQRHDRRQPGQRPGLIGAGDDTFVGTPATAATPSRARPARHDGVQRRGHRRENRPLGQRQPARFTRDVGNITMDLNGVETVNVNALGGADTVTVNDLTGTDVTRSTSTSPARPAAAPATARPTPSSSTAPTAHDTILISGRRAPAPWPGCPPGAVRAPKAPTTRSS